MRFYPDIPHRRTRTIATDAAVLLAVVLFAWLAFAVHDAVDELASLGQGVQDAGGAVQSGFESAAGSVEDAPVVGGQISDGLSDAGGSASEPVREAGEAGEEGVHDLARLLGWLTFLLPTAFVLYRFLPGRIRQVRKLTAASHVLGGSAEPERRRLVAMRAAFALPYGALLRHTRDPLGDLAAERYDPLVAAALEDAGLREPA